jgi:predicted membrane protein
MVLAFEAFVVFFGTLAAFGLKVADGPVVWGFGLTFSAILILTPGYLGKPGSYWFGWALQVILLVVSFMIPWALMIAIIFVGFWGWAMIAGYTIDLAKKNRAADNTFEIKLDLDKKEKND